MTQIDDGQTAAITGGKADALVVGAGGITAKPQRPATDATAPAFVSGTARQLSTDTDVDLFVNINTAAALAIAIGPTAAAAVVVSPSQTSALGMMQFRVPRGWFVKITGTIANLNINAVAYNSVMH